jgi:hypothetical protein
MANQITTNPSADDADDSRRQKTTRDRIGHQALRQECADSCDYQIKDKTKYAHDLTPVDFFFVFYLIAYLLIAGPVLLTVEVIPALSHWRPASRCL